MQDLSCMLVCTDSANLPLPEGSSALPLPLHPTPTPAVGKSKSLLRISPPPRNGSALRFLQVSVNTDSRL